MPQTLRPTIGRKTLFFLIINAIIGTGIYFLPALGAQYAGPASLVSWAIMSIVAIFMSLYFAELISMFPRSGGVYEYTRHAFGESASFIFGWTAWIIANITIAMLIIGSLYYIFPGQGTVFNVLFAIFFILLFNFVSYRGIEMSAKLLLFFGLMTLVSLLLIIVPGLFHADMSNLQPFFVFPAGSLILATYFISETFFGWESIGYLSEEVKDARRTLPKMLVITTCVICAVSFLVAFVSLTTVKWDTFAAQQAPLSFLAQQYFGHELATIFAFIVFIPLIGTAASWIVSSPRLLYAMSRDNVLLPSFKRLHKKFKTPVNAIIFQAIVSSVITIIALGDFHLVLSLLIPLVVFMYAGVMLAVVKLRIDKPKINRYFNAPLPVVGPIFAAVFLMLLLLTWLTEAQNAPGVAIFGASLILFGVPMYILIKLQSDQRFTEKFFNLISIYWNALFPIWYSGDDAEKVVHRLKISKNHAVLDFGCGSGITTGKLAEKARIVVGVDISRKQLDRAVRKIKLYDMPNVILYKEGRLNFKKGTFDAVAAVGVLEYMDNPRKTIRKMISMMKKGGRFSFLTFGRSMGTPAPYHFKNEMTIRKLFKGMPVEVHVMKENKKFTEYWHVWGRKK